MKSAPSTGICKHSRKGLVVKVGILVVVLLTLMLWGPRVGSAFLNGSPSSLPAGPAFHAAGASDGSHGEFYYFRSGQWLADIRTLLAACRYVLEPESA